MSDWTNKKYWISGNDIDIIRCNVAMILTNLEEKNYGLVELDANRINNAIDRIMEMLKEQEGF